MDGLFPAHARRLAIDCANGATVPARAAPAPRLGFDVDGDWVRARRAQHQPRLRIDASRRLARLVVERGCDLGVAFDGDGDRAIFVDATGPHRRWRRGAVLCARQMQGDGPAARQDRRRDGDEQHRPRDRAARSRHRPGPLPGRRQVRDGGDAARQPLARRRAVGPHHLLGSPLHGRRPGDGAERAARDGGDGPIAGRSRRRPADVSAGAPQRAGAGEARLDGHAGRGGAAAAVEANDSQGEAACSSATRAPSRCCASCSRGNTRTRSPRGRRKSPARCGRRSERSNTTASVIRREQSRFHYPWNGPSGLCSQGCLRQAPAKEAPRHLVVEPPLVSRENPPGSDQWLISTMSRKPRTTISISPGPRGLLPEGRAPLDWGMQNRLARIFSPQSGRTVMLAIDHGYFQGPTTGLERVDLNIVPLAPVRRRADAARAASCAPPSRPTFGKRRRAARQRRPEHPQGALQRADRRGHRGRRAAERGGDGGAGVHRRRVRDAVGPQHDAAGGHGHCATASRCWA